MDTTKYRVQGTAEQVAGRVKETVGAATADRDLEARGRGQQAVGSAREKLGRIVGMMRGKLHENVGKLEQWLNRSRKTPKSV